MCAEGIVSIGFAPSHITITYTVKRCSVECTERQQHHFIWIIILYCSNTSKASGFQKSFQRHQDCISCFIHTNTTRHGPSELTSSATVKNPSETHLSTFGSPQTPSAEQFLVMLPAVSRKRTHHRSSDSSPTCSIIV